MAHCIQKSDVVFSIDSKEWHGLARHVPAIGEKEIDLVSFPMVESPLVMMVEGIPYAAKGHKIIAADMRHRVADERGFNKYGNFVEECDRLPIESGIMPLHTPKEGYTVILNRTVIESAKIALADMGMEISTMGTLEGGKKFFLSCKFTTEDGLNSLEIKNQGIVEKTLAFWNFTTSHDGTLGMECADNLIRIVCMNTFRASMNTKGEFGFNVSHTKNASDNIKNLSGRINDVLKFRTEYREVMQTLADIPLQTPTDALYFAAGVFARDNAGKGEEGDFTITKTQANRATAIATLAKEGKGNHGKSRYDIFNGATEFFTSGDGTGKKASVGEKYGKSLYGSAADYKEKFMAELANYDTFSEVVNVGKLQYNLAMA